MVPSDLIPLSALAGLLPGRRGKPVHPNTLSRWCLRGVRGVRLRSVTVGQQRFTSRAWLDEFLASLNPDDKSRTGAPLTGQALRARGS